MNIKRLANHMEFNDIFSACLDSKGKVDWLKVSVYPNLPTGFIDHYFYKLKPYQIEKTQKLDDYIITKYKRSLNWYSLLSFQKLDESTIIKCLDMIDSLNIWPMLLSRQSLSLNFLIDRIDKIRENDNALLSYIMKNPLISDETKETIMSLLRA